MNINATVTGGSPDLSKYPNLVYAPKQWGDHIACHSNGADVRAVAEAAGGLKNSQSLRDVANHFQVTLGEVMEAIQYVSDHPEEHR